MAKRPLAAGFSLGSNHDGLSVSQGAPPASNLICHTHTHADTHIPSVIVVRTQLTLEMFNRLTVGSSGRRTTTSVAEAQGWG